MSDLGQGELQCVERHIEDAHVMVATMFGGLCTAELSQLDESPDTVTIVSFDFPEYGWEGNSGADFFFNLIMYARTNTDAAFIEAPVRDDRLAECFRFFKGQHLRYGLLEDGEEEFFPVQTTLDDVISRLALLRDSDEAETYLIRAPL